MPTTTALSPSTAYSASMLVQMNSGSPPVIELRQSTTAGSFVTANVLATATSSIAQIGVPYAFDYSQGSIADHDDGRLVTKLSVRIHHCLPADRDRRRRTLAAAGGEER